MRVVLDTNVIVSGTFWSGPSFKIISLVDQEIISMVVSYSILQEYNKIIHSEEILDKTSKDQQARINAMLKVINKSILVDPKEKVNIIKDDPDDNKFIEAAIEGKANFIISQDKHLLSIKKFQNITILSPQEFLTLLHNLVNN